ncbi:MAG: isoprenyl transferase [Alphaproteobacteria bacterium]|nr:isoprenyl transferase [Alphaproteobacteria bacterium]
MTALIPDLIPQHVAIIMDGNGRWASQRGLPRFEGHRRGVEALRKTIRAAEELGIRYLTVYSFSSENWKRPATEVSDLMGLLRRFIRNDLAELHSRNIRVRVIGVKEGLAPDIIALLDESEQLTKNNTGLTFVVAFNYGARREIANAARLIAQAVKAGEINTDAIDEKLVSNYLNTVGIPDPELVIRTSGEQRLSNFLLWQSSYSEFVFTSGHWPDFGRDALEEALLVYQSRDRRFGGLSSAMGGVR